jgi:tryptophanyl-tRNA synthetase
MSKSITDPKGTILLTDDPELAAKKILSATTDTLGQINWDWDKQPGITNLLQIYSLLKGISKEETIAMWQGQTQYKNFKQEVADLVQTFLMNLQAKFAQISDSEVEAILNQGASKAAIIAKQTLTKVQKVVGLVR